MLSFEGRMLIRGFWLYIWEITADWQVVHYVGRTGDSASPNAQSPFNRMGHHLGFNENSNALRRRLDAAGFVPEVCHFRFVAHGPVLHEVRTSAEHRAPRDTVAAMEKALAEAMCAAGYRVLNDVKCRKPLDEEQFGPVLTAFAAHFPRLNAVRSRATSG